MVEKFSRFYRFTALLVLGVVLALVVLNGAGYLFLRYFRIAQAGLVDLPIIAAYGERLRIAYPDWNPVDLNDLLYENWSRPFVYESVTQFKEAPIDGRFVNVDEAGFRHVRDQAPWPPAADVMSIFVFGGSTAFGYGVADEGTIASFLQQRLRQGGREMAVYNFGRGFYNSTQEGLLFIKLLQEGRVPDVAVFIDGFNDLHSAGRTEPYMTDGLERGQSRDLGAMALDFWRHTPLAMAFARVRDRLSLSPDHWLAPCCPGAVLTPGQQGAAAGKGQGARLAPGDTAPRVAAALSRYARNREMIEALARVFDVTAVFVLQPVPGYRGAAASNPFYDAGQEEKALYRDGIAAFEAAGAAGAFGAGFISCADVQEGVEGLLYVDNIHYAPALAEIIAACIAERGGLDRLAASAP